ncbi:hypothetical protein CTAYLR_001521 [Chrysophaeum taylorii]|uniref:Pseudouridine synthase RsuA/RluA-like domain-containing protein n=1 Tax=Chrysophaeum taylorii TaxID=2483200 RepID=A0AAD7XKI9_9STRA|nr:hypothetical protein CTAYLR_001521 [Chrysophaeum taylorii]
MHCKRRWVGRSVEEVMVNEFKANPPEYYRAALRDGRITVRGNASCLRDGDVIEHIAHRHEPPVVARVVVVANDARVVAVDKPPSMPMHPCGSYHYNTLASVLRFEHGIEARQVHRLDKLTSGLVVLAKTAAVARELCEAIGGGLARKTYLARVSGDFPNNAPKAKLLDKEPSPKRLKGESEAAAAARAMEGTWRPVGDALEVNVSIACKSHKDGVYECSPDGRPSQTRFRRLRSFDDDGTTLVECSPMTGRTHQIRLHLQWLGHPIANDACYGGKTVDLMEPTALIFREEEDSLSSRFSEETEDAAAIVARRECERCRAPPDETGPHPRSIWLHALRYAAGETWSYETDPPPWAGS